MGTPTNGRRTERSLLVDADDTLWENNIYYLRCGARFGQYMVALGCDADEAARMLDACEQETIAAYGYGPEGYVAALGLACERLLQRNGGRVDAEAIAGARAIGELVLSPPMRLIDDVEETLRALRPSSELILVTKGTHDVQMDKLRRSGLEPLFDACYVVAEKDAGVYRRIAAEQGLVPSYTWMVGNSPRSDINPAIEAGLGAILVPHGHTWHAERQELLWPEKVVTLERFADLMPFFGVEMLD